MLSDKEIRLPWSHVRRGSPGSGLVMLCALMLLCTTHAQAAQVTATWNGGVGNWNDATKWSGGVVPNNGTPAGTTYKVLLDNGNATVSNVTLNISATIDTLTVSSGDTLGLNNGVSLTIATASTLSNAGNIALNSTGSTTDFRIAGNVSLTGAGTVTMSNNINNRILGNAGTERLTNSNTISGAGQIGANSMLLTNQGTILANVSAGLTIDPNGATSFNTATIRADTGGTLAFNSGTINNTGGTIRANAGTVILNNSAIVTGGTVDVVGAGELRLSSGGSVTGGTLTNSTTGIIRSQGSTNTIGGTVSNPAGGQIILDSGTTLNLSGGAGNSYSNVGKILLNSTGSTTDMRLSGGDVSLTGAGTVTMSNNINNRILGNAGTERLTNSNTISGAGQIGANSMLLTNQGTIRADQVNTLTIDITPAATGFTTSGTVQVNTGSTLAMGSGDIFTQTAGNVIVNGTLTLTGGTTMQRSGGTLNGSGTVGGPVNSTGGTVAPGNSPGILSTGNYTQAAGGTLAIELNSATVGTGYDQLNVTGAVNLAGALTVTLTGGFVPTGNTSFTIINNDGADPVTGTFTGKPEGTVFTSGSSAFRISYVGGDGNDVVLKSQPLITISDVPLAEGNSATTNFVFTVSLSAASNLPITVQYATANGTAAAGSDYTALPLTTLTIAAGATSGTITVAVNGDTTYEANETFFVNLSNATNATIADAQGLGTITNDDPLPSISINNVSVVEGNSGTKPLAFTVSLSNPSSQAITVQYATANGTAAAGSDYTALPLTTLTIAAGATSGTITVTITGDTTYEADETFFVNLTTPVNATITDAQGQGTITNDDTAPTLTINDVTVTEGNSGTTNATFTVTLSAASGLVTTVNYATANGTATAGSDYVATSGTKTIAVGATSGTIVVPINGDTTIEANETFFVNLTTPVNATIADAQGQGTITNDDFVRVFINDVTMNEGDSGATNVFFTISLSAPAVFPVTVTYTTANGTATAGSDYTTTSSSVTFNAGEKSKAVAIPVLGDTVFEGNETFLVNLTSPTNGIISDAQGVCTIIEDDPSA